jgi:hypothetical protein
MQFLFSIAFVLFCLAAEAFAQTTDIAAYFPIRQGDAWTYDWQLRMGQASPQTVKRTRAFEGREFVNTGNVDKLASENGDYALFSLDERGLLLHGAAEYGRDLRFIFDPPVTVLTPQMAIGQPLVNTQMAEDGKTPRRFTSLLEGHVAMETPLGKFSDCLKVSWVMDDDSAYQKTTYYLAKGVGIVAYAIEVKTKKDGNRELNVDARLRLAQLQGKTFAKLADLELFTNSKAASAENAKARALFRKAHEATYVWDKKFPGFEATFTLKRAGASDVTGTVRVTKAAQVEVQCADAKAKAQVHAEMSQFVTYRQSKNFDEQYGTDKAKIGLGEPNGAANSSEVEIIVSDEESSGSSFLLRDREIVRVTRSYGRVRFVNQVKNFKTDDGRFIANEAELTYYSNESGAVAGQTSYQDRYEKVGSYWLPLTRQKSETAKDKTVSLDLSLSNVRYLK